MSDEHFLPSLNELLRRGVRERRERELAWMEALRDRADPDPFAPPHEDEATPSASLRLPAPPAALLAARPGLWPEWELVDGQPFRIYDLDEMKSGAR